MVKKNYFIIDFDSTLVRLEALDTLADIALRGRADKKEILKNIQDITAAGMRGEIAFPLSLKQRLALFDADKDHIKELIGVLNTNITPSAERNIGFFRKYRDDIYVISGGFTDYIYPVMKRFGLAPDHILANKFLFDGFGKVIGFDEQNLLARDYGKPCQVRALNLNGAVNVIGDGYTDLQIKEAGAADAFYVFCENIRRKEVMEKADHILHDFDGFVNRFTKPLVRTDQNRRMKVLLLERIHQDAVDIFIDEGYDVETIPRALGEQELIEKIKGVSVLGIRSKTAVTPDVLGHADRLLTIGAFCIGTDRIHLTGCAKKGVIVFNDPYSNTRSVAELVIGEIIMLVRRAFEKNAQLHNGIWDKSVQGCFEVRGKKLGIIGYGNIGLQVSVLAEALGMDVYYYDIAETLTLGKSTKCATLTQLLHIADVVTVHIDGRPDNNGFIGEKEFTQMKDGAIFLNLSRGFVVDIPALAHHLKNGKLAGAAVDVFPVEPGGKENRFTNELLGLPNVILTPHIGGNTVEAQRNIGMYVAQKIVCFINGRVTQ